MFTDQERNIFRYFDGEAEVWGDPLEVQQRLTLACGGEFSRLWADYFFTPEDGMAPESVAAGAMAAAAAAEKFLKAARHAFTMKDFDRATGAGATVAHAEAALRAYADFCDGLKKKAERSAPSLPPPTSPPGR